MVLVIKYKYIIMKGGIIMMFGYPNYCCQNDNQNWLWIVIIVFVIFFIFCGSESNNHSRCCK